MAAFNSAFPILPGKTETARSFASAITGSRSEEFKAMQSRAGTTRETWSLQETPAGDSMLVWFEGDVEKAFGDLATATDDFTVWFRGQIKEVTGLDMSEPAEGGPEMLLDWNA
ncbi:MAG: hypothetical protein ABIP13_05530 [Tepidiformaceae bacterium]